MNEKRELTAVEYLQAKTRMVTNDKGELCGYTTCQSCPLAKKNNGRDILCKEFEMVFPGEAETVVREWAETHPIKTLRLDFLEKFPNAPTIDGRTPFACPKHIYRGIECVTNDHKVQCAECWDRPLAE